VKNPPQGGEVRERASLRLTRAERIDAFAAEFGPCPERAGEIRHDEEDVEGPHVEGEDDGAETLMMLPCTFGDVRGTPT